MSICNFLRTGAGPSVVNIGARTCSEAERGFCAAASPSRASAASHAPCSLACPSADAACRRGTLRGRRTMVFSYRVPQARSQWHINYERKLDLVPAYTPVEIKA